MGRGSRRPGAAARARSSAVARQRPVCALVRYGRCDGARGAALTGGARIEHEPLAGDHLAVLHDRHADAAAAFGIDQLVAWGIVLGHFPPWANVSNRSLADVFSAPSLQICG
jgi:hypothetical protein